MPRRKRIVIPGTPHHLTQRGSRKQDVFFCEHDRDVYYDLFRKFSERYGVMSVSHCLMTNHVHHLVVPLEHDSLRWTFQLTHKCYAEYINARARWSGHLWQERFYSSPVDEDYFWVTIRYIEQNPVKAKMAEHPADYRWSSAAARCSDVKDPIITDDLFWTEKLAQIEDWSSWLSQRDTNETIALLRNRTSRDLPTGSEEFLDSLEQRYGVQARPLKPGRPKREKS